MWSRMCSLTGTIGWARSGWVEVELWWRLVGAGVGAAALLSAAVVLDPGDCCPILIDAGFADLETPIPWWQGRTLRYRFPPR
jgi:hypothetical protein